jgi:hypothetical protein
MGVAIVTKMKRVHSTPPLNTSVLLAEKPAPEASATVADARHIPTDISPDELFAELERIRGEAEAAIERLIDLVDKIDSFDEREPDHDDEPSLARTEAGDCLSGGTVVDGEFEFATTAEEERRGKYAAHDLWSDGGEPVLGSCEESPNPHSSFLSGYTSRGSQVGWADGNLDDREGDGCADDREDECEDEGAEHDGRAPGEDDEPILGWPENVTQGVDPGGWNDYELSGSEVTEAARGRYRKGEASRYAVNGDGKHVDAERAFAVGHRRIRNLSDGQRKLIGPKIDRGAVSI